MCHYLRALIFLPCWNFQVQCLPASVPVLTLQRLPACVGHAGLGSGWWWRAASLALLAIRRRRKRTRRKNTKCRRSSSSSSRDHALEHLPGKPQSLLAGYLALEAAPSPATLLACLQQPYLKQVRPVL
jgi:hypothetical protein